ncbi:MAG: ferritin-like domain-containing protein [Acidimicrobiales bacterium]|nr:ferritin-like domain-containing protein [Acidimicrobiales bacterium]
MSVDDRGLRELISESQDLQSDALREARANAPAVQELGASRRGRKPDLDKTRQVNSERRRLLRNGGFGVSALAARGLLGSAFGAAVLNIVARPAGAQEDVDVMTLQTAASLENLAVATYEAALTLPFIKNGNEVVKAFAMTTMEQHAEHGASFNAQAEDLGGQRQTEANPKYAPIVEDATPGLNSPLKVVDLAATLEEVATDTYLANLSLVQDAETRTLFGSVMGVESQHLAVLRAVKALLEADAADLIALPPDIAAYPAAAGSVAFPQPFEEPDMASPPEEGAVR